MIPGVGSLFLYLCTLLEQMSTFIVRGWAGGGGDDDDDVFRNPATYLRANLKKTVFTCAYISI